MESPNSDLFQEICIQNGISCENVNNVKYDVETLYALFSGLSDIPELGCFIALTELVIISQCVKRISRMDGCPHLRSLWICESGLTKIENLTSCKLLEELYLYSNAIGRIENLSELKNLSILWLNENRITSIDGLADLSNLKALNLSDNFIETLGEGLKNNTGLSMLWISGNNLDDIQEIVCLSHLPRLTSLSINECGFRRNPVCCNANLPLILMYHLPKLKTLDNVNLEIPELRHAIRAVMNAKQGFYSMKAQNVHSVHDTQRSVLDELYKSLEARILAQIQQLDRTMRTLQLSRTKNEQNTEATDNAFTNQCISELKTRITFWEYMIEKYKEELTYAADVLEAHTSLKLHLLQLELELCGYFEFTEGTTNDEWFHRCSKLLISRFCSHHSYAACISGIRIHSVYRVVNKLIQNKFGAHGRLNYQDEPCITPVADVCGPDIKRSDSEQEYLLLICPKTCDKIKFFSEILKSGFRGSLNGIALTNSLNLADEQNLMELLQNYADSKQWTPSRFTTVLVIRVFTASCVESNTFLTMKSHMKNYESNSLMGDKCTDNSCSCLLSNKSYTFPDGSFLLPEFLIEIEYLTKHGIVSPFYQVLVNKSGQLETQHLEEDMKTDLSLIKKIPHRLVRPIITELLENAVDPFIESRITNLSDSMILTVNDVKFPRSLNLQTFRGLTHLRLTHCHLQKLPIINGVNLRLIDFSHNKISSIKNMPVLKKLVCLDVSYNALSNLTEELQTIKLSCPTVHELHLRFNPWKGTFNVRSLAAAMIPVVVNLDNKQLNEQDRTQGKKIIECSKIDISLLERHSSSAAASMKEYTYLTIGSVAEYVVHSSRTLHTSVEKNNWNNITAVSLPNCNLQTLENFERISHLRYLCLDSNQLTTLEDIARCSNLEELSAEHNSISHIDELGCLKKLRRLFVGNNCIKSLAGIQDGSFTSLQVITLRSNNISRLNGLNICKALREMYLGNNNISELKAVLLLKTLSSLTVIDFHGNSITHKLEHYRLRIIHYLKTIRSLDGHEVRPSEIAQSKDLLGGHLSNEFLMDKLETDHFSNLTRLDMPNMGLKIVDYLSPDNFRRLQSVNLEKNQLTSFGGLLFLSELRVLCLNENCIESLFPRNIYIMAESANNKSNDPTDLQYLALYKSKQAIFPYLQVVHLAKNQISSLEPFHFHRMPALRSLFLQHNEITSVCGLEGLHQLRELVLDSNKIKEIGEVSFFYNWSLQEIHIENNRLRELHALSGIESLKRLYVGGNKLSDLADLENFALAQKYLGEISVIDNPITTKQLHRLILIHGLPRLYAIDGIVITPEEKERANAFYADQELQNLLNSNILPMSSPQIIRSGMSASDIALPGINLQKTALLTSKPTNVIQGSNMPIYQSRPSYAIVTIGSQLEVSDSPTIPNRTTKQGGYQQKSQTSRTELAYISSGINLFGTVNFNSDTVDSTHSETSQNVPGMSIKSVPSNMELNKSMRTDLNKTPASDRMYRFSAPYSATRLL